LTVAPAMTLDPTAAACGPVRTCIVTGDSGAPERMIRFVVGPDGDVVPDLARRLPGRGMWVRAERSAVEQAVAKKAFSRAARAAVEAARRAGRAVAGFVRVEQMVGQRRAGLVIVASEADGDGLAKLAATGLPIERLGDAAALGGVFGREQAVYAAVARDDASGRFIQRIAGGAARWRLYRSNGAG